MKHSLCLTSIVSNAQPSESMPTRKSCWRLNSSMFVDSMSMRRCALSYRSACGTYGASFCVAKIASSRARRCPAAFHRQSHHIVSDQGPRVTNEVVGDVGAAWRDPLARKTRARCWRPLRAEPDHTAHRIRDQSRAELSPSSRFRHWPPIRAPCDPPGTPRPDRPAKRTAMLCR